MRRITKSVTLDVEYFEGRQDPDEGVFEGGVPDPDFPEELTIDLSPDEVFDDSLDDFAATGKTQMNLRGSRRSYVAFAKYLLAVTELNTQDPDYHDHFDNVRNSAGDVAVHLIVHGPSTSQVNLKAARAAPHAT